MTRVKALESQSFLDLAIQECGTVEAAFTLALENGFSITDELAPGQNLQVVNVINMPVANYYKSNRLNPATEDTEGENIEPDRIFSEEFPEEFE